MCGLLISVDVPSVAPIADGNLFQLQFFMSTRPVKAIGPMHEHFPS
jgi:hypothetical protein